MESGTTRCTTTSTSGTSTATQSASLGFVYAPAQTSSSHRARCAKPNSAPYCPASASACLRAACTERQLLSCLNSHCPAISPRAELLNYASAGGLREVPNETYKMERTHQGMRCAGVQDCAVRMWDLRSMNCEGLLETPARSAIAFDQQVNRLDHENCKHQEHPWYSCSCTSMRDVWNS